MSSSDAIWREFCRAKAERPKREAGEETSCPCCRGLTDASKFEEELSKREYIISGLCQRCQDSVFKEN